MQGSAAADGINNPDSGGGGGGGPPSGSACPQGSAVADGCAGANAKASFQKSDFFTSYARQSKQTYATRPPWNVAGVDYPVGTITGTTFKDPSTAPLPKGCSYGSPWAQSVQCSGAGPFDFTGWDFGLHNCIPLLFDSSTSGTVTLTNNNFLNGSYCNTTLGLTWLIKVDAGSTASIVASNNSVSGGPGTLDNVNNWVIFFSNGSYTENYNYFTNLCKGVIGWGISTYTGATGSFNSQFNYAENFTLVPCRQHGEWLIPGYGNGAKTPQFDFNFNTFMQGAATSNPAGGYGAQQSPIYLGGNNGHTITLANAKNNTLVANCWSGACSHANVTTAVIGLNWQQMTVTTTNYQNNYLDPTGAFNCTANATAAAIIPTVNMSGNINLRDGSAVTWSKGPPQTDVCNGHQ